MSSQNQLSIRIYGYFYHDETEFWLIIANIITTFFRTASNTPQEVWALDDDDYTGC